MFNIECGEYLHFKGKPYVVYGTATLNSDEEYVLYQHDYGTKEFWIRPVQMFTEIIERDGCLVQRFKLIREVSPKESLDKIVEIFNEAPFVIYHSETLETFKISSIDTETGKIMLEKIKSN